MDNIENRQREQFGSWLRQRVINLRNQGSSHVSDCLYALAIGPHKRVHKFSGCIVGGVRFLTKEREEGRKSQNSGVCTEGQHKGKNITYYGILKNIYVLDYPNDRHVALFECEWYDLESNKPVRIDDDFVSANIGSRWYEDDSFLLASQVSQVFYVRDTKLKGDWQVAQKAPHRHLVDPEVWNQVNEDDASEDIAFQEEESTNVTIDETFEGNISCRHDVSPEIITDPKENGPDTYPPLIDNRVGDWIWLCNHFETEEVKKRSTIGKANRSNLPYVHKKGTKSFVAVQHELNCGDISLYKECYSCDKKGWASEDARNKHEEMLLKQIEPVEEGEVPLTEQQICEQVLGKAYGYIRGRGHGPKPNRRAYSSASNSTQHVVEELASTKEIVATQQTQIEAQQSQLESQQKKIDWLQSVVSNLVGISPPMDGTSATEFRFTTDGSVLRSGYRFVSSDGSMVSDGGSRR